MLTRTTLLLASLALTGLAVEAVSDDQEPKVLMQQAVM